MIGAPFNDAWDIRRRIGPFEGVSGEVPELHPCRNAGSPAARSAGSTQPIGLAEGS